MSSSAFPLRLATEPVVFAALEQIARDGARRALQKAIEDEVAEYLNDHCHHVDDAGHRLVVRNGRKPPRTILSGVGPLSVIQPRVDDRRVDENGVRFRFTSRILPPYLRKTQAIEDLIPWLYLKGICEPIARRDRAHAKRVWRRPSISAKREIFILRNLAEIT